MWRSLAKNTDKAFCIRDHVKKILGGSPIIRKLLKKSYYFLYFCLQRTKPPMERKLYPIENSYYRRAVAENGDMYVACDLPMLPAAYRAAREKGAALVYDAHEFYTEQQVFSSAEKRIMAESEEALVKCARSHHYGE